MGIPTECRLKIYDFAFSEDANVTTIDLVHFKPREWQVLHPLLLASKQIHREASERYRLTLKLYKYYGFDDVPSGLVGRLGPFLAQSVSKIMIWTMNGYENSLTRETFPKLDCVVIEKLIMRMGAGQENDCGCAAMPYAQELDYNIAAEDSFEDVRAGDHDKAIAVKAKEMTDRWPRCSVPSYEQRAFELFYMAPLIIARKPQPGVKETAQMHITWNYDTNVIVQKTGWVAPRAQSVN